MVSPNEYAESMAGVELVDEVSVKGVFFAKFERAGETFYRRVFDGQIDGPTFDRIGHDGNFTYGVDRNNVAYMVDDSSFDEQGHYRNVSVSIDHE